MLDDPRPGHGLIGVSDPDIHHRGGTWSMFIGAFTTRFVVRIVEARLPVGARIDDDSWTFVTDARGRAVELGAASGRRGWDAAGMHTPSYVRGSVDGREVERIYYAGRSTQKSTGPDSRYAIGYLEHRDGAWHRRSGPVLTGDAARPSALEPFVVHSEGLWRMWFLSAIGEVGRGEQPDYELRYTESVDGTSWGAPERFASVEEGFFDNTVFGGAGGWRMVLARGTNLYGTTPFPSQGLWLMGDAVTPGGRGSWSPVERLLDTGVGAEDWYGGGVCGPAVVVDGDVLHVFATGTDVRTSWLRAAVSRVRQVKRPPVFAPYFLTTGRFTFHRR